MKAEATGEFLRAWVDAVWNGTNDDLIDQLISPDYVGYSVGSPEPVRGIEGFRHYNHAYKTAFPDLKLTVEDVMTSGDQAYWRFRAQGTHRGTLNGIPPTGRPVDFEGMLSSRFADGKWVEDHIQLDLLLMLQQIGAIPAAA